GQTAASCSAARRSAELGFSGSAVSGWRSSSTVGPYWSTRGRPRASRHTRVGGQRRIRRASGQRDREVDDGAVAGADLVETRFLEVGGGAGPHLDRAAELGRDEGAHDRQPESGVAVDVEARGEAAAVVDHT